MPNFIPKPYKSENITVRLDLTKVERLDKIVSQFNLNSRSELINQCIDFALEHLYNKSDTTMDNKK